MSLNHDRTDVERHLAEMQKQFDIVPVKPEWLTVEQLQEYANQLRRSA